MKFLVHVSVDAVDEKEALKKFSSGEVLSVGMAVRTPPIPMTVQPEPWPTLLIPLKLLAKEGDRGAGDIIARTIGPIGGEAFKKWYKRLFEKDCGCGNRQEALNTRWPL